MSILKKTLAATGAVAVLAGGLAAGHTVFAHDGDKGGDRGGMHRSWGGPGPGGHPMGGRAMGGMLFDRFDTDGDGKVTTAEIEAVRGDRFAKYDADKNGTLSLDEFRALWTAEMERMIVRAFQRLDADGNAQVTATEADRPLQRIVERLDRDGDGEIAKEDMRPRHFHRGGPDRDGSEKK